MVQKPCDSECYTQLSGPFGIYLTGLFPISLCSEQVVIAKSKATLGNYEKTVNELIKMNKLKTTNTGKTLNACNRIEAIHRTMITL
jgi:hypothetical protein